PKETPMKYTFLPMLTVAALALTGCTGNTSSSPPKAAAAKPSAAHADHDHAKPDAKADDAANAAIAAERAKLSPEDRALAEAQEWCAVMPDDRLGCMDAPIKLMIKGQPVFLCCDGCKKKALADEDKTLAKVEELKAKAKAAKQPK